MRQPRRSSRRGRSATALTLLSGAAAAAAAGWTLLTPSSGTAATKFWNTSTAGNWSTASNWVGSTVPAATGDTVNLSDASAGVKTITFDGSVTTTSMAALTIGGTVNTFTGQMTLIFPTGSTKTVAVTGTTSVGGTSSGTGTGKVQQDGATFNNTGTLSIGGSFVGLYNLTSGTLSAATEQEAVSAGGISTFTQTGGVHNVIGSLTMSSDPAANATYVLSGGSLSAPTEILGNVGSATFNHSAGTHTNTGTFTAAQQSGSQGFYTLSGTGALTSASQVWGNSGTAQMTQSGGVVTVNGAGATDSFVLASTNSAFTVYSLNGGSVTVTAPGGVVVGKAGNGGLNQTGGTLTVGSGRDISIAAVAGGQGNYFLAQGATLNASGNVYVGGTSSAAGGSGSLTFNGNANITGTLKVWNVSGNSLSINSGANVTVASIDAAGNGSFNWNGGILNITGPSGVTMGNGGSLPDGLSVNSGQSLNVTNVVTITGSGFGVGGGVFSASTISGPANSVAYTAGSFTLTSGGLNIDASGILGPTITIPALSTMSIAGAVAVGGSLTLGGGSFSNNAALTNTGVISGNGVIGGTGGGITNSGLFSLSGGNLTITKTGVIQNNATGIILLDAGRTLTVNGGNLQNSGTVDLDGGGTLTTTSGQQLINNADGEITGAGTINMALQNSGTIVVPSSLLSVNSAFTNLSGASIKLGEVSSRLTVTGTGLANNAGASITGIGRINGTLNNSGYIEAMGGVLQFAGNTNNNSGGTLASASGTQLFITGAPGANAGTIALTGGTLHTNSQPFTNGAAGVISGYGTIRTGGLTNNGQILLSGGSVFVNGILTSNAGSKVIVSNGATATFYDPVTMLAGSEFRVSGPTSTAIFFAPVTGQANFTGLGTKSFEAGGSLITSAISTGGDTIVQNGATLTTAAIRENSLTVNGDVSIAPDGTSAGTSRVNSLFIAPGKKLDISNNKLIVAGAGSTGSWNGTVYTGVTGQIASGRNGTAWNGSGIITSQSAAANGNFTTLGVATAGEIGRSGQNFGGINVSASDVLVMYTYGGDANLDGKINIDDYVRIDNGIASGLTGWVNGDFNYDGKINIDDYSTSIDVNIGNQGPAFPSGSDAMSGGASGVTAVPEPTTLGLLVLPVIAATVRRRRRSN